MGPEFGGCDEGFADGVFADVSEFFSVVVEGAEAVIEVAALPLPLGLVEVFAGELAFPVGYPFVEGEGEVARRAEKVEMVGHENVVADEPGVGSAPDFGEGGVGFRCGEPGGGSCGADGEEDDGGLVGIDFYAVGRVLAADVERV